MIPAQWISSPASRSTWRDCASWAWRAAAARSTAADTAARLAVVIRDPKAQWLLSSRHSETHCELRLTGVLDGQIRNVVIDRSFIDEQGQRWVIDYKTSSHSGGDLPGFLAEERERYRSQLELYMRLARGLGPQPVRAALYFPWLGELLEVSLKPTAGRPFTVPSTIQLRSWATRHFCRNVHRPAQAAKIPAARSAFFRSHLQLVIPILLALCILAIRARWQVPRNISNRCARSSRATSRASNDPRHPAGSTGSRRRSMVPVAANPLTSRCEPLPEITCPLAWPQSPCTANIRRDARAQARPSDATSIATAAAQAARTCLH